MRMPRSPPAAPTMILSLIASGAPVICTCGTSKAMLVSQTILPVALSVAIMRAGEFAAEITSSQNAAPQLTACLSCSGSMRQTIRPASPEVPSIL